ncbi:MAG: hypothetical protein ABJA11_09430, partial [Pseudolysinimonas sp.]
IAERLRRNDDSGYVLAVVIGLGLIMLLLVATTLSVTTSGETKSYKDSSWNAALAAAYAGIEDYKSRIANDSGYARYGNPNDPYTGTASGLTLPTGAAANIAFTYGAGQWATVPGSGGNAQFRYEIDNSKFASTGVMRIRSTGKVGTSTRSVIGDLKQNGFSSYVYFTDFEVQDPLLSGAPASCANYYNIRPGSCQSIQFAPTDVLHGRVHSNDSLLVCGATFEGAVTSATNPTSQIGGSCSNAVYKDPSNKNGPKLVPATPFPATNGALRDEVYNNIGHPDPACLYTGPTSVTFTSDGYMTVFSPWTKFTSIAQVPSLLTSSNPPKCGTPGTSSGQLGSLAGARIPVLDANLMFVQTVPPGTSDPNYSASSPLNFVCTKGTVDGRSNEGWKFSSLAYPMAGESPPLTSTSTAPAYGCRNGDAFVSGTLNGHTTIASENYVYVVGDLRYSDNRQDLLGLVGQNSVWIWDPMKIAAGGGSGVALIPANRTIYGALLSVQHSIQVQNYQLGGDRGTLTVVGSIAQKFRGTVGQGTGSGKNGFSKDYGFDSRLTYLSPPKFLQPTAATYNITQLAGVPPAFSPSGGTP